MQLGRVFISSVFGGMQDFRETAEQAARLVGLEPVLTERLVAQPGAVRDRLWVEIQACDTYVGLFDKRRGTVPKGDDEDDRPRAISEEEFALARKLGLRCLVFLSRAEAKDRDPLLTDFLETEVTEYRSGLWTRPYQDDAALRREIAAGLATLRPRVVLALTPGAEGLEARLFLRDVAPVWKKETVLGPVPVRLDLSPSARQVLAAFRKGEATRSALKDEAIRFLGQELGAAALPDALGEALDEVLALAARRLVTLQIRTADPAALALPWELLSLPRHPLPVREGKLEVVRRFLDQGEPIDPSQDPAATLPAEHLSVLGFTAAPLEDEAVEARLGIGGLGSAELFWEREQERLLVAFEDLLRERRGRLLLPDTGEKEDLRHFFAQADRPQVVHIACHGSVQCEEDEEAAPVLLLEDENGRRAPLDAEELLQWHRAAPGEAPDVALLVLAACSTAGAVGESDPIPSHRAVAVPEARAADEATGMAEALVRGGFSRVLGMQSTVSDSGATAFAEKFYDRLADGTDLSLALRAGRAELAARGEEHEWAIPTLTTRCDAGPLVVPAGSTDHVDHPFNIVRGAFEIEGVSYLEEGYVGRRETERRLRQAFENDRLICVHGLGGVGKSILAARFLERRQAEGERVLILYAGRELAPVTVFEEVAKKLGLARPVDVPSDQAGKLLRQTMKQALLAEPTVLFLDNFEDNQKEDDGTLKDPALRKALLDLTTLGGPDFRILFTSRQRVSLGPGALKVRSIDLGGLTPAGCRKLRALDRFQELRKLSEETWQQALFHFGGHPKALELLDGYLREQPDRARRLLADMGPAVTAVTEDLEAEHQEKGRKLLVDAVLQTVPDGRRPSFERLCLLDVPLPTEELEALLAVERISDPIGDLAWLRDHGFLARTVAPSALAGGDAVHRLLASRQHDALAQREGAKAARAWHLQVANHLAQGKPLSNYRIAARHLAAAGERAGALELYNRWAIALKNRHAYSASIQLALEGLERIQPGDRETEKAGAANLRLTIYDALTRLGRTDEARKALDAAYDLVREGEDEAVRLARASTLRRMGKTLVRAGETKQALSQLEAALAGFEKAGALRDRAVVLGEIALLRAQSGDVNRALDLHEEELGTYKKLNDRRSMAVTLGDIARLRAQTGEVAEARKLHEEAARIFKELKAVGSHAVAWGEIARLQAKAGNVKGALKVHRSRLGIFERLGEVRERALTLGDIGRLTAQSGDREGALSLHRERLQIFEQLGDVREHAVAQGDIARLLAEAGETEEALKLHQERLEIFERLTDLRSHAVTLGDIARLQARAGDREGALKLHRERLRIFEHLIEVGERAVTLGDIALLELEEGNLEGALTLQLERLEVNRRLGDVGEIAATQRDLADLERRQGKPAEALKRLVEAREAFRLLERAAKVKELDELIRALEREIGQSS